MQVALKNLGIHKTKKVWFAGNVALEKGQGVNYDRDYGTATDADESRDRFVEVPTTSNNLHFAGNVKRAYDAYNGNLEIEVDEPGGLAYGLVGADTVVNTTILGCTAGSGAGGYFVAEGLPGRGSFLALQTQADRVIFSNIDGTAVIYTNTTKNINITDVGKTPTAAGDKVLVFAGMADDDAAVGITPGVYTIASVTDDDNIVLTTALGQDCDPLHFVVLDESEVGYVLGYLFDGPESGGVEFVQPLNGVASQSMVGGLTRICSGHSIAGDATSTLADGTQNGMKKALVVAGTIAANDYVLAVTSGLMADLDGGLATLSFDGDGEFAVLEWQISEWVEVIGTATAAAP